MGEQSPPTRMEKSCPRDTAKVSNLSLPQPRAPWSTPRLLRLARGAWVPKNTNHKSHEPSRDSMYELSLQSVSTGSHSREERRLEMFPCNWMDQWPEQASGWRTSSSALWSKAGRGTLISVSHSLIVAEIWTGRNLVYKTFIPPWS